MRLSKGRVTGRCQSRARTKWAKLGIRAARQENNGETLARVTVVDGAVIDADYLMLVEYLDGIDPYSVDYSIIRFFDDEALGEDKWIYHELDWHVVGLCVWRNSPFGRRAYVALSEEGHIEIEVAGGEPTLIEHIPEAGLHEEWSRDYGYVYTVREIGSHLYVVGSNHQVYRRGDNGDWRHFDEGILIPEAKSLAELHARSLKTLMDIAGLNEQSIYAAGYDGEIFHHDGRQWTQIQSTVSEDLFGIKIVSEQEVYIIGANGTLLKGNHWTGFKDS